MESKNRPTKILLGAGLAIALMGTSASPVRGADFTTTTPLPQGFMRHTLVHDSGFLYNIGGINEGGILSGDKVYYAPVLGTGSLGDWVAGIDLPEPHIYHEAVAWNGTLYVIGGFAFDGGLRLSDEVYYSVLNSDGSPGPWQTTTPFLKGVTFIAPRSGRAPST